MKAITALIGVEEYLATSFDPDLEYVDGQVLERNLGEHDHSRLQALLTVDANELFRQLEEH